MEEEDPNKQNLNPRKSTPMDEKIGKKIRIRRILMGFSQDDLAPLIGVTFQQLQKYESGINRISASRLFEASKILEVDIAYFFEDRHVAFEADDSLHKSILALAGEHKRRAEELLNLLRYYNAIKNIEARRTVFDLTKHHSEK